MDRAILGTIGIVGLLAAAVALRSLWTGRLPVFFSKLEDIERAREPLRFWTQFAMVAAVAAVGLFFGALLIG